MINEILTIAPIINSLGKNKLPMDKEEEDLKNEFIEFQINFDVLENLKLNDKIGRDSSGKYYLFNSGYLQKGWRLLYRENRNWTFKYLDEDFTKFMVLLDKIIAKKKVSDNRNIQTFIKKVTEFIDNITPGLYNLKKTYIEQHNLVAKIDSIIVTLIDFKDKTRELVLNVPITVFRNRAFSE